MHIRIVCMSETLLLVCFINVQLDIEEIMRNLFYTDRYFGLNLVG